jgi:hypothetical protein
MLEASGSGRWETRSEISAALRSEYGLRVTAMELREWITEVRVAGEHQLRFRRRRGSGEAEYLLR